MKDPANKARSSVKSCESEITYRLASNTVRSQVKLPRHGSQRHLILQSLVEARGQKVALNILCKLGRSGNVATVVSSIRRKYGASILNEESHKGMIVSSYYWLTNWQKFDRLFIEEKGGTL